MLTFALYKKKTKYMPTLTIINSIKALSPAEQLFIIEQVLRCMREKGNQQAGFTEIGTDYIQGEEVANIPEISAGYMSHHRAAALAVPNRTTQAAIKEIRNGGGIKCKSVEELFEKLNA